MTQNDPISLSPLQENAINLILLGKSQTAIADELKIGRKTLVRWLKHPIFKAELEARQLEISQEVQHKILSLASKAISKLEALLDSSDPQIQFKTATFLLSRIPVQANDSNDHLNWENELRIDARIMAEKDLDKDFIEYGGYHNYLMIDLKADYQEIMKKKKELEKFYFEELKKEELADL